MLGELPLLVCLPGPTPWFGGGSALEYEGECECECEDCGECDVEDPLEGYLLGGYLPRIAYSLRDAGLG